MFNKYFIPGPDLMDSISCDFFFEGDFFLNRSKIKITIHRRFTGWIFFQSNFNVFEIV